MIGQQDGLSIARDILNTDGHTVDLPEQPGIPAAVGCPDKDAALSVTAAHALSKPL